MHVKQAELLTVQNDVIDPAAAGLLPHEVQERLPKPDHFDLFPVHGWDLGDVVADTPTGLILVECKGGIINTRHPGQVSRLYKGLCETVGMLMATPVFGRQVACVPLTEGTMRLAQRLAPRCASAGIEIALVGSHGKVVDVRA